STRTMSSLATRAAAVWGSGQVRRRRPATGPKAPLTASMTGGALLTNNAGTSRMDGFLGLEKHAPASPCRPLFVGPPFHIDGARYSRRPHEQKPGREAVRKQAGGRAGRASPSPQEEPQVVGGQGERKA